MAGTLLFLSHEASRTGAPIFLLNLLRWFRRNRSVDFRILTGSPGDLSVDFEDIGKVDSFEPSDALWYKAMRRLRLNFWYDSYHRARLRETFLNENVSLIYVNSVASAGMLHFLSFVDCPVICHVHELAGAIDAIGVDNLTFLEKRTSAYIAVSHAAKNSLVVDQGIQKEKIEVIHGFVPVTPKNGIDPEATHNLICKKLGLPEEAKLVCACGSIEYRKGTDIFLEVATRVVQEYRMAPVHFVWVGGSPDRVETMRRQVANSVLKDAVHFVGRTSSAETYFKAAEIFLLTSREDPFPLVVMEAAQQGKPIVCFANGGGAPEFVEGDAGFVIPDFSVVEMADKVIQLLSSPSLRDRMGAAAKQKVLSRYDLDAGAARIAAVIERFQRCERT